MDLKAPAYQKSVTFAYYYFSRVDQDTASNDGMNKTIAKPPAPPPGRATL